MIALSHLPVADWGRADPASLAKDGYIGNAVAYRCVRMVAEKTDPIPRSSGTALARRALESRTTIWRPACELDRSWT